MSGFEDNKATDFVQLDFEAALSDLGIKFEEDQLNVDLTGPRKDIGGGPR